MTYQEIKDRLSKCEITLEKLKNGTHSDKDVKLKTEKLELLRESYLKLLKEADKGVIYTDDEKKAKDLADDGANVKLTIKERLKEQEGVKFSIEETKAIAKKIGQAVAKAINTVGDEIGHMKAKNIEENSFEIYVEYKNDAEDQFSFYIVDDTLHLVDFSFDKEISDVGVKPSGEALVNVDVVANELVKHFKSMNEDEEEDAKNDADYEAGWHDDPRMDEAPEGMYYIKIPKDAASQNKAQVIFDDLYGIKYEINDDPEGIVMYFKKEDFNPGVIDDLEGDGVQILDTNVPMNEGETDDYKYKGKHQGSNYKWPMSQATKDRKEADKLNRKDEDVDVGHQDDEPDMLQATAFETAQYAAKLVKKLQKYDNFDGEVDFPNWWQSKLILAKDYMQKAYHYLDSEEKQPAIDQLALEEEVNERLRFLSPEKQKANDAKFDKRMALLKALEKGIELHKAGKISDEDLHNLKLKAGTICADSKFKKEELDENRFLAASMEDLEQVIRNLAHTGEMSEDEAIELAIRKLEAMLDGRDDMDEGRKDNDALFPDNPRLPEIKKLADKIVSMVKAEAAKGELGYIKTMEEIRYQQEDDFERTPEWNKAKGIRADFDDYGSGTNEGLAKTQKAHGLVVAKMKELAKQYKAGNTSVVDQLKDLTAKKKQLEKQLEKDVAGKNRNQQLDTNINEGRGDMDTIVGVIEDRASDSGFDVQDEAIEVIEGIADHFKLGEVQFEYQNEAQLNEQATCCGRCGRVHVKGTKCKTPYLKGKDHCRNN